MKAVLYVATLVLGVVLVLHLAMNGQVGNIMKNSRVANAVFWCIGALTAVIIGLTGWKSGAQFSRASRRGAIPSPRSSVPMPC